AAAAGILQTVTLFKCIDLRGMRGMALVFDLRLQGLRVRLKPGLQRTARRVLVLPPDAVQIGKARGERRGQLGLLLAQQLVVECDMPALVIENLAVDACRCRGTRARRG